MNFDAAAESYDAFMGRYSSRLSPLLADFAGVGQARRALDVGCGPGALTAELVRRLGHWRRRRRRPDGPFRGRRPAAQSRR